jgi:hypothetical protein
LLFIDFRKSFSREIYQWAVSLQFVPTLLKTVTVTGAASFGFILVLLLTLLFGRVYCSVLCPLGIFQDVVSWFSGKTKKKRKYKYSKAWTIVRYTILAIVVIPLLFGSITLVTILDPYSLFGRISTTLLKPVVVLVNNMIAAGFAKADIYNFLYRYDIVAVLPGIFIVTTIFLAGIILAALCVADFIATRFVRWGPFWALYPNLQFSKLSSTRIIAPNVQNAHGYANLSALTLSPRR